MSTECDMVVQAGEEILVSADCAQPGSDIHITVGTGGGDSGPVSWDDLLDKPTTVSGFGLTDAVTTSDARLTNPRNPTAHAASHAAAGSDPLSLSVSQVSGAVSTGDSRLTDAREWTATTISQAEAESGTATTRRAWTALRVRQAVEAWWAALAVPIAKVVGLETALDGKAPLDSPQFTNFADAARFTDDIGTVTSVSGGFVTTRQATFSLDGTVQTTAFTGALKTKLDGIASGATANATDAQLRDRSTHTGTQASSTVTVSATDRLLGRSTAGAGAVEEIVCTAFGRSLIDDADAATARTTLGLATVASSGSASDLATGTLANARLTTNAQNTTNAYAWASFR